MLISWSPVIVPLDSPQPRPMAELLTLCPRTPLLPVYRRCRRAHKDESKEQSVSLSWECIGSR